jgi:hypothetical protein
MDLREIGLGSVDWIRLAQDRDRWQTVVSAVMNLWVLGVSYPLCLEQLRGPPSLLPMGTGGSFIGINRSKGVTLPLTPV